MGRPDVFEFWRSAPYLLNLMDQQGYKVKEDLLDRKTDTSVARALEAAEGMLPWEDVERYRAVDPGNAKLRGLIADSLDTGAWRLPWLPPSLPYVELSGAYADPALRHYTKRLVFSAWTVVPKAISVMVSYEAERRAVDLATTRRESYSARRTTPLLQYRLKDGAPGAMPVLALAYPSSTLAQLGDPLAIARAVADRLPAPRDPVLDAVRDQVARALDRLPISASAAGPPDRRWYWAAPVLLDRVADVPDQQRFEAGFGLGDDDDPDDVGRGLAEHVAALRAIRAEELGPRPDDLVDVLARLALAGPGVCALRALSRVAGGHDALADPSTRLHASVIAGGLRSLFNRPEMMAVLRAEEAAEEHYWRLVLDQALDGGLQATLDEYAHVLLESEGLQDAASPLRAERIAGRMREALRLKTTSNAVDEFQTHDAGFTVERHTMRSHFAARFGRARAEDQAAVRETHVQTAFNSPFWPFVLASTSVGQEGLDFHTYSHAVVHWNLPGNPVDLEQREGRVHRYKGHAVRKNVAAKHADAAFHATVDDPWFAMFLAAAEGREEGASDIVPSWVYAGPAAIERYVPAMPLSSEVARYHRLQRTVGAYRLVIGQPRQGDLIRYVGDGADLEWMQMDLGPRPR